ncbi:uncharacterized protein YbjQ (UPF0145 family) [Thermostichus sp. MS-CIW-21]
MTRKQAMLLTTTDVLQGREVERYLGIVTAEVVYGTNVLRDFLAALRNIIGGRTRTYEEVLENAQKKVLEELEQRAKRLGANGILGVSIHTNMSATMILVTAAGTAVKLR